MRDVKCECGHVNPHGTVLCESCGKIFIQLENEKELIDMRYEGSARRSQTYNKTIIDKIWNFFSSVKVGVWLIVITLIASSIGTLLPQKMYIPERIKIGEYYEEMYGIFGKLYYFFGFHEMYSSWWYLMLIASIGVSLVICSIDRVVPLYKSLKKQSVTRHEGFLKRQRLFSITEKQLTEREQSQIKERLVKRRYHLRAEGGNLLAEKGRFSRWGPYINHVGLIIFLIGAMLRFIPGMYVDEVLWLREGETKVIPGTNGEYYLENNQFIFEIYDKDTDKEFEKALEKTGIVAKNFQTDATLYKRVDEKVAGKKRELEKVKDESIRVNEPLKFNSFALYQAEYKLDELDTMEFTLENKQTEKKFGTISVDLNNPDKKYLIENGYSVEIISYFPDFVFGDDGEPTTQSNVPNNPAFVFKMFTPEHPEGEISFVAIQQTIEPFGDNNYRMAFSNLKTKHVTGLVVRKDLTLGVLMLGGIIFMIGLVQGAYWNHRRIWICQQDGETWLAGHTNKNWHGLKREIASIIQDTSIHEPVDQSNKEAKQT